MFLTYFMCAYFHSCCEWIQGFWKGYTLIKNSEVNTDISINITNMTNSTNNTILLQNVTTQTVHPTIFEIKQNGCMAKEVMSTQIELEITDYQIEVCEFPKTKHL